MAVMLRAKKMIGLQGLHAFHEFDLIDDLVRRYSIVLFRVAGIGIIGNERYYSRLDAMGTLYRTGLF
jgi:hypothetical protein